jgi:hypothetical protein
MCPECIATAATIAVGDQDRRSRPVRGRDPHRRGLIETVRVSSNPKPEGVKP